MTLCFAFLFRICYKYCMCVINCKKCSQATPSGNFSFQKSLLRILLMQLIKLCMLVKRYQLKTLGAKLLFPHKQVQYGKYGTNFFVLLYKVPRFLSQLRFLDARVSGISTDF